MSHTPAEQRRLEIEQQIAEVLLAHGYGGLRPPSTGMLSLIADLADVAEGLYDEEANHA